MLSLSTYMTICYFVYHIATLKDKVFSLVYLCILLGFVFAFVVFDLPKILMITGCGILFILRLLRFVVLVVIEISHHFRILGFKQAFILAWISTPLWSLTFFLNSILLAEGVFYILPLLPYLPDILMTL